MKILFFSDIHGITKNLAKLEQVIKKNNFTKIVNLGDMYHCSFAIKGVLEVNPSKVKDFLNNYSSILLNLRGNCDKDYDILTSKFPICNEVSLIRSDGLNIYCTHGDKYNIAKTPKLNGPSVLIYGHYHKPYIKKDNGITYVCVGSVSLPRDSFGPTYAIYENRKITIYSLINNAKIIEGEVNYEVTNNW